MLIDKLSTLFDGRDGGNGKGVTADKVGDTYDDQTGDYIGTGNPFYFVVVANNVATNPGRTYNVKLVHGTGVSGAGAINAGKADVVTLTMPNDKAASKRWVAIPGGTKFGRYLQAEVDVSGAGTSFDVTAFLTHLRPESGPDEQYPDAISFSADA